MKSVILAVAAIVIASILGMAGPAIWVWTLVLAAFLAAAGAPLWVAGVLLVASVVLGMPRLRRALLSAPAATAARQLRLLPIISETERIALEAGTVWVDGELFSGRPDWHRILDEDYRALSAEEATFLAGPVERACAMVDDWETLKRQDLSPEVWRFLRDERFFGLVIPKSHGGLGFTAMAHASVITKLASRSLPLAVTVMVPNSLGPAELLVHYGTREQKERYLPRLARGEEIPCFALTEPEAGSDAAAMTAHGVVFRGEDGQPWLRLSWKKRYITLASVSTVMGLAFKLHDPENLLGRGESLGITCALVPSDAPGVALGRRHDPLGVPFINCPTEGHDVVVPASQIIGGVAGAGHGWRMLMETLAAGRGISLPSMSVGTAKLVARVAGAHAGVRRQFGMALGRFEGIEEPLARIAGLTYVMEAVQVFTCSAVDGGQKPSVISAIAKYEETELARQVVRDGMDVLGGAGIVRGPRNLLAALHVAQPIGITVEGANILTRSMIIFGQGVMRCHPCAYDEIAALGRRDMVAFDRALWKHASLVVRNGMRAILLSLTRGRLARAPVDGPAGPYFQRLSWVSASFATLADLAMVSLGGSLKRRESLGGRLADMLSWMYLGTCVLRRFEADGRRAEDVPLMRWAMEHVLKQAQSAREGVLTNFPSPVLGPVLRWPAAAWARLVPFGVGPVDALGAEAARRLRMPSAHRDRLTAGIYLPSDASETLARLEEALGLAHHSESVLERVREAVKARKLRKAEPEHLVEEAVTAGILKPDEAALVQRAARARSEVVQVDSFPADGFVTHVPPAATARERPSREPASRRG